MYRTLGVVLSIGALLLVGGCTSTQSVTAPPPETEAVRAIESESRDQSATLTLVSGRRMPAVEVQMRRDSVRWAHPSTHARQAVSASCVQSIRFTRHGLGTLEGLGIGAGTSIGAGLLTALVPTALGRCEGLGALACGFAGMAVAVVGTLAGTVAGAVRGHHDVYRFASPESAPSEACREPTVSEDDGSATR